MRVLFVDHFSEPKPGGGQHYALRAAVALKKAGHEADVVCLPDSCVASLFRENGFQVHEMDFYSKNFLQGSLKMFRFLKKADYDAVLCQSFYESLITFPVSIACRQLNFVRLFHTEPYPVFADTVMKKLALHLRSHVETRIFKHLKFIAVSKFVASELIRSGVKNSTIEVVRPFILNGEISQPEGQRSERFLNKEEMVLASCGRMVKSKRFETLISAVQELKKQGLKVRLIIFGTGPEEHRLKGIVSKTCLEDAVDFRGYAERWYAEEFDVYATASLSESFSLSLFQAAMTGVPCVASDIPAHREVLGGEGFFFNAKEPSSCVQALRFVYENRDAAIERSASIRKRLMSISREEDFNSRFVEALLRLCNADSGT